MKQTTTQKVVVNDSVAIPETIRIMGSAMRNAAEYLPLRNHAAALATLAPPHDFLGQLQNIYQDTVQNWRYVRDPVDLETLTVTGPEIYQFVLGFNGGVGRGLGAGDCDDIAIALGSLLLSVGFPVRIVTSSEYQSPDQWTHVFIQAQLPGGDWITLDPVLYPSQNFGATVEAPRLGYWDLNGRNFATVDTSNSKRLAGANQAQGNIELNSVCPWGSMFGNFAPELGYIESAPFPVELGPNDKLKDGNFIVPLLSIAPEDLDYVSTVGFPYPGMKAIGSTGYIYEWRKGETPGLGYKFGDGFRAIGRAVKRAVQYVWDKIENVFEATAFGRWILRVKDRVLELAVKVVTPLAKFIARAAPAVAPAVALIPGIGPVVAAALVTAGGVAQAFVKWGIPIIRVIQTIDGEEVELMVPNFETEEQEQNFALDLIADAETIRSNFTDQELTDLLEAAGPIEDLLNPDNPQDFTPEMQAFRENLLAELDRKQAGQDFAQARAAQDAARQRAAQIATQQAAAIDRYHWATDPEIQQAAAQAQAAAVANNQNTLIAAHAAQAAAQAADQEYQAAQVRVIQEAAAADPAYREKMKISELLGLELIGFQVAQV